MKDNTYYQKVVFSHDTEETTIENNLTKEEVIKSLSEYFEGWEYQDHTEEDFYNILIAEADFTGDNVDIMYAVDGGKLIKVEREVLLKEIASYIYKNWI